jgi:hypothetical protein
MHQFQAFYEDDLTILKARFEQGDIGEEHPVRVHPRWENQRASVAEAFGREMMIDSSKVNQEGYIFVKSPDRMLASDPVRTNRG